MSNTRRADESGTSTSAIGNRLGAELSPYLLQHADNPVDWYPWGEEAFERARREDRPIFLSIGYSTCHWCHVMEHESFEDEEVAALLNDSFVCIKVDREERPDIDQVYMAVCQMVTGGGGWPLTIIMTPDRRPFFAGTYIPKHSRLGRTGLLDLIPEVRRLWREQRADLLDSAQSITEHLRRTAGSAGRASDAALNDVVLTSVIDTAFHQLESRFDSRHGGFGTSPKFPSPHNLIFLLHFAAARGDGSARMMATTTLGAMRRGGLWDHVGFGFHRYSTDREWLVPHFEKMLYDQAMLLLAFTEAWLDTRKPEHEQAIRELVSYVLRDMTDPKGGFYSAEDADSEGVEGKHYLWSMDQLVEVLGEEDARAAATLWNASTEGNFEEEASGRRTGANILHLTATSGSGSADVLEPQRVASIRQRLFSARCRRVYPLKDDKILADWNGLMAAALAKAGAALGEPAWIDEADRAVSRVLEKLRDPSGRLLHRMRDGVAAVPAFLDDHVFLTLALIVLHQARLEPRYLEQALSLQQETLERFWDRDHGGLFVTAAGSEELLVRPRELYDGAIPSGASVAVANLLRLARLTGDTSLAEHADALVRSALAELRQGPAAHTALVDALLVEAADPCEVVVAGEPGADDTGKLLATVRGRYLPGAVLLLVPPGPEGERIHAIAPFTLGHSPIEGRAAAYVCRDHRCDLPVTDPGNLAELLDSPSPPSSSTAS